MGNTVVMQTYAHGIVNTHENVWAQGFNTAPTYTITFTAVETSDFIVKRP